MALVQTKQGSGTGSSLTITLDSPTTAGNALIVVLAASGTTNNPTSVSAITLGGAADNFSQISTFGSSSDAAIGATWLDLNCAGGQTSVAITIAGGSGTLAILATVYEWSGLYPVSPFDQTANAVSGGSTSWSSGATPTTVQAAELWIGAVFTTSSGSPTITGPASPWTNLAQVNQVQGSFNDQWLSGWQVVSSTGSATYAGSVSASSQWISKVITLRLDTGGPYSQTFSTSGTWQCPSGVTAVQVECWGGGGAGGSARSASGKAGGGGAGGCYVIKNAYPVSAGTVYTVTVGGALAASTGTFADLSTAGPGNDSWFDSVSGVLAKGGASGQNVATTANGAAGTGSTTGCIGDTAYPGGNGAAGVGTTIGGGGGGGAGSTGAGGSASGSTAGSGTATGGGNGGNGTSAAVGGAGSAAGGAGGGARTNSTTTRVGGAGAAGRVILTWSVDSPVPRPIRGQTRPRHLARRAGYAR